MIDLRPMKMTLGPGARTKELLQRLNGAEKPIGAEIGIFNGAMSKLILAHPSLTLYMVDNWKGTDEQPEHYKASGDYHANRLTAQEQEGFYQKSLQVTDFAKDRRIVLRMDSVDAAKTMEDGSLDFVFIDCDHSYEGCKSDIEAWATKVKAGGLLSGHDYALETHPNFGVTRAVNEAVAKNGWNLELADNYTWFVRL